MPDALVLSAFDGPVCTLTLNRPQSLNSFTTQMHRELRAALDAAADSAQVRCVVLTGAGRAFCAGQDLSDPAIAPDLSPGATPKDIGALLDDHYIPLVMRLREMPVPVLAAVNGVAAGAGANVALNCDMVIAAKSASFIQAFSKIALIPDAGGTWLLPHLVGRARALGLAMSGDKLSAEEAERIGLIWRCVEDAAFADTVRTTAGKLAAMPTHALVATRHAIDRAIHLDLPVALATEARVQAELGAAHDYLEGAAAFLQKRSPVFKDR